MAQGFWKQLPKPFYVLAPMADVTDVPFRGLIAKLGRPDVFYTEFVSAHGLNSSGREVLQQDLELTESDHPIVAQFFGTEPEHFKTVGKMAKELGFDGVDINMGCPDRSIMKQGAGIAMAKDPDNARACIESLREGADGLPVTVKTRLGLYSTDEMHQWLSVLLTAKPDVLAVHGRTMKEMSNVPAHWDLLGEAAAMAHDAGALFVGNGDVVSRTQGSELAERWSADGLMVGRGIFQNPWLFNAGVDPENISAHERIETAIEHTNRWVAHWSGKKSFHLMRKFYKVYIQQWPGAASLRAVLMAAKEPEEALHALREALASHASNVV